MRNRDIAQKLREQAAELARRSDNLYRVRAYRQAALAVQGLENEVAALVQASGPQALENVPGIGKSLSETIAKYALN